ncbi:MAG TPA: saccharopine dehydrogenase NADP-binding domain-containing protein [Byssovorax sp.]|jgi:short subunit dehydrogenase-like uncharacterized protein
MRELDVVVFGATGFTGRLVASYLSSRVAPGRLALAGRDAGKLAAVADEIGAGAAPRIVVDAKDAAALAEVAARAQVVCTTVGPYARYGNELVAACVAKGTDYCDLTGEPHFMRRMIDRHHEDAVKSGARIVHTCGFDSIPSDLGVYVLQAHARAAHGAPASKVTLGVRKLKGGASGGTVASLLGVLEDARRDRDVRRVMLDPYSLNPDGERRGADGPGQRGVSFSQDFDGWAAPFMMAGVNERVVRRTNALSHYAYGEGFRYGEVMTFKRGAAGFASAVVATGAAGALLAGAALPPLMKLAEKTVLPKPGEGPSAEAREAGSFDLRLVGHGTDSKGAEFTVRGVVTGKGDPGYAATSRMLGESALCLALDPRASGGGVLTPAIALGDALVARLRKVDFTFDAEG